MAEVVVDVSVDSSEISQAEQQAEQLNQTVDEVTKGFQDMGDAISSATKEGVEGTKQVQESTAKATKGTGLLAGGFKAVGLAIKSAGIGLVIGAVTALSAAFSRNRKIMDAVDVIGRSVAQVFNQILDAVVKTYESVAQSSENFNGLGKVLKGVLTLSITPLKLAFFSIKLAIQEARLAWEQSFFGGGDEDTIQELNLSILETKQNIVETGEDAIKAGTDIVTNFGDAVGELGEIGSTAIDNLSEVSVSAAIEQAKANKAAEDASVIAQAEAGRLAAKFERQAELQRRIRDNELISIDDRIKANNELAGILDEQEKQLLAQADAVIAGAQAQLQKNNSLENEAALIDAKAAKEQVLADIASKRSEQEQNRSQLLKDQLAIEQLIDDAETLRAIKSAQFAAEQIQNEELKLAAKLKALNDSEQLDLEKNQREIDRFAEGTEQRAQAEQDRQDIIQEYAQQRLTLEGEISKASVKVSEEEQKAKMIALNGYASALSSISSTLGQETAAGKGIAVASALINTSSAIAGQLSAFSKIPVPGYAIAQAIATGAAGLAQVKKILSVKVPKGSGGGSRPSVGGIGGGASAGGAPNFAGLDFGFLGEGGEARASDFESLDGEENGVRGVRAYVASDDVTRQQSLDQKVTELASLNGE